MSNGSLVAPANALAAQVCDAGEGRGDHESSRAQQQVVSLLLQCGTPVVELQAQLFELLRLLESTRQHLSPQYARQWFCDNQRAAIGVVATLSKAEGHGDDTTARRRAQSIAAAALHYCSADLAADGRDATKLARLRLLPVVVGDDGSPDAAAPDVGPVLGQLRCVVDWMSGDEACMLQSMGVGREAADAAGPARKRRK